MTHNFLNVRHLILTPAWRDDSLKKNSVVHLLCVMNIISIPLENF